MTAVESLQRIIDQLNRLLASHANNVERLKALNVYQRQVVTAYFAQAVDLPLLTDPPQSDDKALVVWERLAQSLESKYPGRIPPVDHIADMHIPIIGEGRVIHDAPPERVDLWLEHAIAVVRALIDELDASRLDERKAITNELAKLEQRTPVFDRNGGLWAKNTLAAQLENVGSRSLARYRQQGIMNAEKTLGKDNYGRVWRRPGTASSHPWYLKSTLKRCENRR